MDPLVGAAVIGGAANIAGDIFSQSNARSAFKSRYQDTVADMRKAGLNPALAYGQGGGNPQTMNYGDWGSGAASAAQAVLTAKKAKADTELTQAQTDLLRQQTAELAVQPRLRNQLLSQDANLRYEQVGKTNTENSAATIARDRALATYDSDIAGTKARNKMPALLLPEAQALAKWFRAHPDLAGWLNSAGGLKNIIGAMGTAGAIIP